MMATLPAERRDNPVAVFRQTLQTMQPEFKMALPAHIPPDKFARVAQTAINNTPDLLNCDRRSLLGAIVRLAQDGLLPDGREAALVKFRTKENGTYIDKVQAMPMIFGILKKMRQSGDIAKVSAQVVYENDHFIQRLGFDEDVEHVPPALGQPRGKPIGAYATAVLKDGSRLLEVMDVDQIEKVRGVSKAKDNQYGPWVQWWDEMARKTVMRRLSKRLPMSSDLYEEIVRPEAPTEAHPAEPVTIDPGAPPMSRLDALEHTLSPAASATQAANLGGSGDADAVLPESERGETITLPQALDEIAAAGTVEEVENLRRAHEVTFAENIDDIRHAASERIDEIGGGR